MTATYEVTTVSGHEEVLAGRIYRTRTSGSFEYDTHGADALAIAVMSSRIDTAVAAVS